MILSFLVFVSALSKVSQCVLYTTSILQMPLDHTTHTALTQKCQLAKLLLYYFFLSLLFINSSVFFLVHLASDFISNPIFIDCLFPQSIEK
jgi:hypothetical protein